MLPQLPLLPLLPVLVSLLHLFHCSFDRIFDSCPSILFVYLSTFLLSFYYSSWHYKKEVQELPNQRKVQLAPFSKTRVAPALSHLECGNYIRLIRWWIIRASCYCPIGLCLVSHSALQGVSSNLLQGQVQHLQYSTGGTRAPPRKGRYSRHLPQEQELHLR